MLLTQESGKKSASRDEAIISARVVFPQPGGPRKSKEGHCLLAIKVDRALPSQIRWDCPTKVSSDFGRRSDERGSIA